MSRKFPTGRFPSKIVKNRRINDFICTETVYAANQTLGRHAHECAGFVINLRGTFTENCGKEEFNCTPTSLLFRPPDRIHSDHFHELGGKCLTVEIPSDWMKRARDIQIDIDRPTHIANGLLTVLSRRLFREFCETDPVSTLAVEGLILEIIAELSRQNAGKYAADSRAERIEKAREMIRGRFFENLSLTEIAAEVDIHPVHLSREFRRHFRCTVGEYIRRLRIRKACAALSVPEIPLAEIALSIGFSDQSHFTRVFKREIGITPNQYRESVCAR
ncbi:MAG: AraC family transcriptional regulator [Pyrinomonadaceae bacterium]